MPQKQHKPDEIVAKLWQVDVLVSQSQSAAEAVSWRKHHDAKRPRLSLGNRPPAPDAVPLPAPPSVATSPANPTVASRSVMHQE